MTHKTVIVGAGQAGLQVAVSLRMAGYEGAIAMIGEEAYPPYERPPLSKALLSGETEAERLYLKRENYFSEHRIDLRLKKRVAAIDPSARAVRLETGETLPYDACVIATGSRVRRLAIEGATLPGVHYLRGLDDALALKAALKPGVRIGIVGGGYIGLEVAASAAKLGAKATVIEMLPKLMSRAVAPEIADYFAEHHRAHGVDLRLGQGVQRIEGAGRAEALIVSQGARVAADLVVIGVGVVAETALAEAAGLQCDNGVVVDECGRTSDPHIFAAGDVTNHPNALLGRRLRLESVPNAVSQAKAAAAAILGRSEPYAEIPWFWSEQFDLKLQIAGLSEPGDELVIRGDMAAAKFSAVYLRDGRFAAINTINNLRDFNPAKRLIADGARPDRAKLADAAIPLKDCV